MSEWKEYRLNQITEPIKDGFIPSDDDIRLYIGLEHIEPVKLRINSTGISTDVTSNKFIFVENDTLFGKLRPYFRKVVKPRFSGICSTDIWVFRAKEGFSQDWLFYFLADWNFVNLADSGDGGTRMPRADWDFLKNTLWEVPFKTEQQAIADVLSSLDDKIDLLHRQNKTLESMAETLFRQWFIEEAQDDWEEFKVSDIANHLKLNIVPSKLPNTLFHHYSLPAFDEGQNPVLELGKSILSNKYQVSPNTILVSKLNPRFPRVWAIGSEINEHSICSTEFQIYKPKDTRLFAYLYFLFKSENAKNVLTMAASGTSGSHQRVRPEDISNIPFMHPNNDLAVRFSLYTQPYLNKINQNKIQIQTLEKLRDTLLPKLMSGEISIDKP